jgi:hypothetical protein
LKESFFVLGRAKTGVNEEPAGQLRALFRLLQFLLHRRSCLFIRRTKHRDGRDNTNSDCKSDCRESHRHTATVKVLAKYRENEYRATHLNRPHGA